MVCLAFWIVLGMWDRVVQCVHVVRYIQQVQAICTWYISLELKIEAEITEELCH